MTEDRAEILLKQTLSQVLGINTINFCGHTRLLGALPEFDSMAVFKLLVQLENNFSIQLNSEDLRAENFESLGSLTRLVCQCGSPL